MWGFVTRPFEGIALLAFGALFVGCSEQAQGANTPADASADSPGDAAAQLLCDERAVVADSLQPTAVAPSDTDPAIGADSLQYSLAPAGEPAGKLFVFLGGFASHPVIYQAVLRHAAAGGYHAIGLTYSNDDGIMTLCAGNLEADCPTNMRHEVITGEDVSPVIDIDPAHSIDHRLVAMLEYLGWNQYLDGDQVRWQDVTVAGHSLGGGHSMFIAQLRTVHRAIAMAQPWEVASWTLRPMTTPSDRLYGLVHTGDTEYEHILVAWENLGLPGSPVDIDELAFPYDGAHRLVTDVAGDQPHHMIAVDFFLALDENGRPMLAPVWCHLFGP